MVPGGARTVPELALGFVAALLPLSAAFLFVYVFARRNLLAYGLAAWAFALRGPAADLFAQPNPALQFQGWIVAAVLVATLAWAAYGSLRASRANEV
jgi:hypothetical protein